jgi:hypothetical protein
MIDVKLIASIIKSCKQSKITNIKINWLNKTCEQI